MDWFCCDTAIYEIDTCALRKLTGIAFGYLKSISFGHDQNGIMDLWLEKINDNTIQMEPNDATEPHFEHIRLLVFVRFFFQ